MTDTVQKIKDSLAAMNEMKRDGEATHIKEDDIWKCVLMAIAGGANNPALLAKTALDTISIHYEKSYGRRCELGGGAR